MSIATWSHRLRYMLLMLACLLLAACNRTSAPTAGGGDSPLPPAQAISLLPTFTLTFTPTVTPAPTKTLIPREMIREDPNEPGWMILYGRGQYATDDFSFQAHYRAHEWELAAGPALVHKVIPECWFIFSEGGHGGSPPPSRIFLTPRATIDLAILAQNMTYSSYYDGDDDAEEINCRAAAQSVADSIAIAPPSPGRTPTITPVPDASVRADTDDVAWSILNARAGMPEPRFEVRFRTGEWSFTPGIGAVLFHVEIADCEVVAGNLHIDATRYEVPMTPAPPVDLALREAHLVILSRYWGDSEQAEAACRSAAQAVADTLHTVPVLAGN